MVYPILAPSNTWYKSSALRSTITQINIVDTYTPTGNESETWNADVDNSGSIKCYLNGSILTIAGNGSGKIIMNSDSSYLFSYAITATSQTDKLFINCTAINGLDLFDSSNVSKMNRVFAYCISLTELNLSSWDVRNVTTLEYAFGVSDSVGIMHLETLNISGWNITNKCTSIRNMFLNCEHLTYVDVSNWDVSGVTSMYFAFYGCKSLTSLDVSNWSMPSCTTMQAMFYCCNVLQYLDTSNWNVCNVTDMSHMFRGCYALTTLDVSKWNINKATNMVSMFEQCHALISIDVSNWDVSNVLDMRHMFNQCFALKSLDVSRWNVGNVTNMQQLFTHCSSLTSLDLSNWNTSKVTTFENMLYGMQKLEKITIGSNFRYNGNGSVSKVAVLPTPSSEHFADADGFWYTYDGVAYTSDEAVKVVPMTYYAVNPVFDRDYLTKGRTVLQLAKATREKFDITDKITVEQITNIIKDLVNAEEVAF